MHERMFCVYPQLQQLHDLTRFGLEQNATIADQQGVIASIQATDKSQEQKISSQQGEIAALTAEIATRKAETTTLKAETATLKDEIATLKNDAKEARHIETGSINCGTGNTFNLSHLDHVYKDYDYYKSISHSFNSSYTSPPVVFISITHSHNKVEGGNNYIYQGVVLTHVNNAGFTVGCGSNYDTTDLAMEVSWISVPQ